METPEIRNGHKKNLDGLQIHKDYTDRFWYRLEKMNVGTNKPERWWTMILCDGDPKQKANDLMQIETFKASYLNTKIISSLYKWPQEVIDKKYSSHSPVFNVIKEIWNNFEKTKESSIDSDSQQSQSTITSTITSSNHRKRSRQPDDEDYQLPIETNHDSGSQSQLNKKRKLNSDNTNNTNTNNSNNNTNTNNIDDDDHNTNSTTNNFDIAAVLQHVTNLYETKIKPKSNTNVSARFGNSASFYVHQPSFSDPKVAKELEELLKKAQHRIYPYGDGEGFIDFRINHNENTSNLSKRSSYIVVNSFAQFEKLCPELIRSKFSQWWISGKESCRYIIEMQLVLNELMKWNGQIHDIVNSNDLKESQCIWDSWEKWKILDDDADDNDTSKDIMSITDEDANDNDNDKSKNHNKMIKIKSSEKEEDDADLIIIQQAPKNNNAPNSRKKKKKVKNTINHENRDDEHYWNRKDIKMLGFQDDYKTVTENPHKYILSSSLLRRFYYHLNELSGYQLGKSVEIVTTELVHYICGTEWDKTKQESMTERSPRWDKENNRRKEGTEFHLDHMDRVIARNMSKNWIDKGGLFIPISDTPTTYNVLNNNYCGSHWMSSCVFHLRDARTNKINSIIWTAHDSFNKNIVKKQDSTYESLYQYLHHIYNDLNKLNIQIPNRPSIITFQSKQPDGNSWDCGFYTGIVLKKFQQKLGKKNKRDKKFNKQIQHRRTEVTNMRKEFNRSVISYYQSMMKSFDSLPHTDLSYMQPGNIYGYGPKSWHPTVPNVDNVLDWKCIGEVIQNQVDHIVFKTLFIHDQRVKEHRIPSYVFHTEYYHKPIKNEEALKLIKDYQKHIEEQPLCIKQEKENNSNHNRKTTPNHSPSSRENTNTKNINHHRNHNDKRKENNSNHNRKTVPNHSPSSTENTNTKNINHHHKIVQNQSQNVNENDNNTKAITTNIINNKSNDINKPLKRRKSSRSSQQNKSNNTHKITQPTPMTATELSQKQ